MNPRISEELQHLSPAEKFALGEALIDGAYAQASSFPLTHAQSLELQKRLLRHRANPNEPGVTFAQLAEKLLNKRH
jgi:putative addiction module component (TIGR02574 family)